MKIIRVIPALALVATFIVAGCGKSSGGSASSGTATSTAAAKVAPGTIVATCVKGKTTCVEYKNAIPDLAEDICKGGPDYVWKPGSTPCPTDKLLGKCVVKLTPDEASYWYGGPDDLDLDKGICEAIGQWIPANKLGASSASASATSAAAPASTASTGAPAPTSAPRPGGAKKKR